MEDALKKGFTLIEIIVSLTLLAVAFLSLYQFFIKSQSFSGGIRKRQVALLLARKKAEHAIAGIDAADDTVSVDTLDNIIYRSIIKMNKEVPPLCSVKVYSNKRRILTIRFLKEIK